MKAHLHVISLATAAGLACAVFCAGAAEPMPPALSAAELAGRLSALQQDGTSYVRLRLEVKQPPDTPKSVLQIQIKQRRTKTATEVVYQILWPKERQGEAVLLRGGANQPASGFLFTPPDTWHPLDTSRMKDPLFGSDLSYADVLENFFAWDRQAIVGTEVVDRVACQILESKPGKGQRSIYASVRSWVDPVRLVPLRVEKSLAAGQLARRIDTTRVVREDDGNYIPSNLTVRAPKSDSATELDGSRLKRDVVYSGREFTPEGLRDMTPPRSSAP